MKNMPMVYQNLHTMTRVEVSEISELENSGSYTRKMTFSGYKGSMSKEEGIFDFLEITLFGESEEELEITFNNCEK